MQRLLVRAEFIRPLSGRRIVLCGKMKLVPEDEMPTLAGRLGGEVVEVIDPTTSMLVLGSRTAAAKEAKEEATRLNQAGASIEVVSEREFLGLIIGEPV